MDRPTVRAWAITALQYAVAVAALAWVLSGLDLDRLADLLGRLDAATVAGLVAVTVGGLIGRFYTWHVLVGAVNGAGIRAAASVDLVVNFVNQLLPSRLSGRVAAPFVLRAKTGMDYADAAAVAGVHTGIYAVLYAVAAALGLVLALERLSPAIAALLVLSTGLYLVAGGLTLLAGWRLTVFDGLIAWGSRVAGAIPRVGPAVAARLESALSVTDASMAQFQRLTGAPSVWARYAVGWTAALVVAPGLRVLLLLGAFGVPFEPAALLGLFLVAAYSVTLLPLTPGGIGITEATATVVLVSLGIPSGVAVPVVLLDRALGVYLPALAGWYPSLSIDRDGLAAGDG